MIRAVAVVVPARDEQAAVAACLRSVEQALRVLPLDLAATVLVVADRCADRTAQVARAAAPWADVLTRCGPGGVGASRALGVHAALRRLAGYDPSAVWILNTDADTRVPADWAHIHLRHAGRGADAVAGRTDLDDWSGLSPSARGRYRALLAAGVNGTAHSHVYGANLGVRADAYLAVGGFHPFVHGEDRDLCDRLTAAGRRVVRPLDSVVATSARLRGRARGGLADLLRDLQ